MKIKGYSNYEIDVERGVIYNLKTKRFIGSKNLKGYWQVKMTDDNGKVWNTKVHKVVWIAVNGEIPEGMQVNHIDENKDNNSISNLNLLTAKENCNYGTRNERAYLKQRETQKHFQVYCFKDGCLISVFPSTREAHRQGFNSGAISACCRGERKHHRGFEWQYSPQEQNPICN